MIVLRKNISRILSIRDILVLLWLNALTDNKGNCKNPTIVDQFSIIVTAADMIGLPNYKIHHLALDVLVACGISHAVVLHLFRASA